MIDAPAGLNEQGALVHVYIEGEVVAYLWASPSMGHRSLVAAVIAQRPDEANRQPTETGIFEPLPRVNQVLEIRVGNRPAQEGRTLGRASG